MGDAVIFQTKHLLHILDSQNTEIDVVVGSGSQSLAILQHIMDE